jgi:hypothetical protein
MESYHFGEERFKRHDPGSIIPTRALQVNLTWPYTHEKWKEEDVKRRARSHDEVLFRIQKIEKFREQRKQEEELRRKQEEELKKKQQDEQARLEAEMRAAE